MPNAVEEALNRASAEQRDRAYAVIDEAKRKIQIAEIQKGNSTSGDLAATIAENEAVIADAKRSIPQETMQNVDEISAPMNTPPMHGQVNPTPIELNPTFKSQIESIEKSDGNNYLTQNAVDRALARQEQEPTQQAPQQEQEITR